MVLLAQFAQVCTGVRCEFIAKRQKSNSFVVCMVLLAQFAQVHSGAGIGVQAGRDDAAEKSK